MKTNAVRALEDIEVMESLEGPALYPALDIEVAIDWDPDNRIYHWTFSGPHVQDGSIILPGPGTTNLVFTLATPGYELLYINLDPELSATHQMMAMHVDSVNNSITVTDRNTDDTPFSLSLVARMTGKLESGFASPDPQIINHPNNMCNSK